MGEAKRRKQRDLNYGKVHYIKSRGDSERHALKLFGNFSEQLKEIQKSTNLNSNEINQKLTTWMEQQLSYYTETDRKVLANEVVSLFLVAGGKYITASYETDGYLNQEQKFIKVMRCLIKVLEPWLDEEIKQKANGFLEYLTPPH
jgi:hypothetical protein